MFEFRTLAREERRNVNKGEMRMKEREDGID